jgi:hypothetical protein
MPDDNLQIKLKTEEDQKEDEEENEEEEEQAEVVKCPQNINLDTDAQ